MSVCGFILNRIFEMGFGFFMLLDSDDVGLVSVDDE